MDQKNAQQNKKERLQSVTQKVFFSKKKSLSSPIIKLMKVFLQKASNRPISDDTF